MPIMSPKLLAMVPAAMVAILQLQPVSASAQDQQAQPCQAQPDKPGNSPDATPKSDMTSKESKLGGCNGVLTPPTVGDPELVKPAPDVGKMPVIPPRAVPENGGGSGTSK
jgi:hypothetical protein